MIVLKGHRRGVDALTYSADGALLASGDRDGLVRIWATGTFAPLAEFRLREARPEVRSNVGVHDLQFSHDRRWLVASGLVDSRGDAAFNRIVVWDCRQGRIHEVLPTGADDRDRPCEAFGFSPNGTVAFGLIDALFEPRLVRWDTCAWKRLGRTSLQRESPPVAVRGSNREAIAAVATQDARLLRVDLESGRLVHARQIKGQLRCADFDPDDLSLVGCLHVNSADRSGLVRIDCSRDGRWRTRRAWQIGEVSARKLRVAPDGQHAVMLSGSARVRWQIRNPKTGDLLREFDYDATRSPIESFDLAPDLMTLAIGTSQGHFGEGLITILDLDAVR